MNRVFGVRRSYRLDRDALALIASVSTRRQQPILNCLPSLSCLLFSINSYCTGRCTHKGGQTRVQLDSTISSPRLTRSSSAARSLSLSVSLRRLHEVRDNRREHHRYWHERFAFVTPSAFLLRGNDRFLRAYPPFGSFDFKLLIWPRFYDNFMTNLIDRHNCICGPCLCRPLRLRKLFFEGVTVLLFFVFPLELFVDLIFRRAGTSLISFRYRHRWPGTQI